jgi:hypothetical protein
MAQMQSTNDVIAVMTAIYDFQSVEQCELSLTKGETVSVLDMDLALNGWAYTRKQDGTEGYCPISYIQSTNNNNNNNRQFNGNQRGNTNGTNYNRQQQRHQQQQSSPHQNENKNATTAMQIQHGQTASTRSNAGQQQQGDAKQIICSFHRDFIPEMNDLYKYFGQFGKITNKLEIEYDSKKVPLAKVRYESADCVNKVVARGNRQQIPSGAQSGAIHIRVYRNFSDYMTNTHPQRNNRQFNNNNNGKGSMRQRHNSAPKRRF